MAKDDFNRDLDDYLSGRKGGKKEGFRFRLSLGDKEEKVPKDLAPKKVHVLYHKPGFFERLFSRKEKEEMVMREQREEEELENMEQNIEETDKEISELRREEAALEKKKEGMMASFLRSINIFAKEKDEIIENLPVEEDKGLDADTVEVLKIASKWINRLPPEEKAAFRQSSDYARYKEFLDRKGLTKR